jgi:5'-nucleotidase (lipoprotein e(P4) family)
VTPAGRLLLALALTTACRTAAPTVPVSAPGGAARSAAVTPVPGAIRWVRESAEHRAAFLQAFKAATARVEEAAATRAPGTWAVVLDADETLIDNSVYQLERSRRGLPFDAASWRAWTERREATALPGAAAFLARVRALSGRIAIVTNRSAAECPDTEAVFSARGLVYDVMLCRPAQGPSDKNPRFEAVARGTTAAGLPPLEIVAFVGDNVLDFPALGQSLRGKTDAAFGDFGSRFFLLPNPMYGSWETP